MDIQMLMFQIVYGSHTGQQYSRCGRTRQSPIGIALDGLVNILKFLLMNPSLLFALLTILLMHGF